jgi:bifunctional enzyme CysN/CysC
VRRPVCRARDLALRAAPRSRPLLSPEARDPHGRIENFTGLDSGYEPPDAPEIRVATVGVTAEAAAGYILDELRRREII